MMINTYENMPIYQYSYKGMIYYHRSSFGVGGKEGHKRITRKIRINQRKPNKAYIPYSLITYWIFV